MKKKNATPRPSRALRVQLQLLWLRPATMLVGLKSGRCQPSRRALVQMTCPSWLAWLAGCRANKSLPTYY